MTTDLGPAPAPSVSFGALLKRLRLARESTRVQEYNGRPYLKTRTLSLNELARRAGVDTAAVHRHEAGSLHPSRRSVERLADALEVGDEERARLLVAAGYWPWQDLDEQTADLVLSSALGIVAGDWRMLPQTEEVTARARA